MKTYVYCVFSASPALVDICHDYGCPEVAEASVWILSEYDRTGRPYSRKELEDSFWQVFHANLYFDEETEASKRFRERCVNLGFSGCWSVVEARIGGPAEDIIEEGLRAKEFLAEKNGMASDEPQMKR